jgi:hypothetical protein
MANRGLLHPSHIPEFAAWTETHGYQREAVKGEHEALRLRPRSGGAPLLYYRRDVVPDHLTCQEPGLRLVRAWLADRRACAAPGGSDV